MAALPGRTCLPHWWQQIGLETSRGTLKLVTHVNGSTLYCGKVTSSAEEVETERTVYENKVKQTEQRSCSCSSHLSLYHIGVVYFTLVQVCSLVGLNNREEPVDVKV